jgi:PHP family Zn ribbon phosphoesterase
VKRIVADLHIHTALSACADDEMTPPAIVEAAILGGLDMIAICDHNSSANAGAVQTASQNVIVVLAGIEITTAEEAHVLGIFPNSKSAEAAGVEASNSIPVSTRKSKTLGRQLLLDAGGDEIGEESRMLFMASGFDLDGAVDLIRRHGGIVIASHVDRPSNSIPSQLGMFPEDVTIDALEISANGAAFGRADEFRPMGLPLITSSDAHFLNNIGASRTAFLLEEASFEEFALAIRGVEGRRVLELEANPFA